MLERILILIGDQHGASKELANHLGIRASVITDWRSGRNKSYTKYAAQIADYYGVSLDWLSGLTDDQGIKKEAPSEDEAENKKIIKLRERLSAMSEDELDKLIAMMDLMGL